MIFSYIVYKIYQLLPILLKITQRNASKITITEIHNSI